MKYPVIEVNRERFSVNLMDTDFTARLAGATTTLRAALSEAEVASAGNEDQIQAAKVTATCAFFDAVFGAGAARRIFKYYNEAVEYTDCPSLPNRRIGGFESE